MQRQPPIRQSGPEKPHRHPALLAVCASLLPWGAMAEPPDLSQTIPILDERFEAGLNRFDGLQGVWSTLPRRGQIMTNSEAAVFVDVDAGLVPDGIALPDPHRLDAGGLALRSLPVSGPALDYLRHHLARTRQGQHAAQIQYVTGMISTWETWSQSYGWFEIEARIPRGRGRWPAFWLTYAGRGWPPEIDIFEAYGAGIAAPTGSDNRFNTATHFDAYAEGDAPVYATDLVNPYDPDQPTPEPRLRGGRDTFRFGRKQDAAALGSDLYDRFNTFAVFWTPETITYYFGPDRTALREIYRVPTPEDAHSPMYLIANDQFTARGGWWPADGALDAVLDRDNAFRIRRIHIRALRPEVILDMTRGDIAFDTASTTIQDTTGDDTIDPGPGFDVIALSGGADTVHIARGRHGKLIEGFGADDRLIFEGWPMADGAEAMARLTQVGPDVWLTAPGEPFWPQTVILRGTTVAALSPAQFVSRWPVGYDKWRAWAALDGTPLVDGDGDRLLQADPTGSRLDDKGRPTQMVGSPAPDHFLLRHPSSQILPEHIGGADTLYLWGRQTLPPFARRAVLRGTGGRMTGQDGDERLELEGAAGTLAGGAGDDLYIIHPSAEIATIALDGARGHDRLRGWTPAHRIILADRLIETGWTIAQHPRGTLLQFGPETSLLIEGILPADLPAHLSRP